ncbi:MAG: glycosyltransferase [Anaerolineales bacterium]|nr:glycosyltransferase [Anaerolineales bacterium]
MKICCISPSRIPSETANSIQAMKACHALAQLDHQVVLIAPGKGPQGDDPKSNWDLLAKQYGLTNPFEAQYLPPFDGYLARRIFPWRAALRAHRLKPDLIYTWMMQSAVMGLVFGLPVILELHDLPPGRFGRIWYRGFLRMKGNKKQMVITRALADALEESYPEPMPATIIAPNGVDLARYANLPAPEHARHQLGLPEMPTAACTGHLYEGRGVELFLSLAGKMPDVHFLWVGGRPRDVQRWQERADALSLENVSFPGFVPNADLPLYQAAADILLMPYQPDVGGSSGKAPVNFFSSMKMYEYMASNRPVISSDLPVIHEFLDAENAILCPPSDQESWQQAIRQLLNSPEEAARLAARARQQVEPYSWVSRAENALEGFPR